MKKIILVFIFGIITIFTLNSCVATAYSHEASTEVNVGHDDADINIIISNGIPYYFEGRILYYLYNGWYYYPYYTNRTIYFYRYSRPFSTYRGYKFIPRTNHRPYYRRHEGPRYNNSQFRRYLNRHERYRAPSIKPNVKNNQSIGYGRGNRNSHFGGRR